MIKVFKRTNPRLENFKYYFYSMSNLEDYQNSRMGEPITDDIIEEVDLDETKFFIDRFFEIREASKCTFYLHEGDEDRVDAYDGTLYLNCFEPEEFLVFNVAIDNMNDDEFNEWRNKYADN